MAPELLGVEDEGLQEQASMTGGATCSSTPDHICRFCNFKRQGQRSLLQGLSGLVLQVCVRAGCVCEGATVIGF